MPRKHAFVLVVLLGAAAVAGLLAMSRTAALGSQAKASSSGEGAISFRMQKLDRLEASLRKQLRARGGAAVPVTVLGSSVPSAQPGAFASSDDQEFEGEEHAQVSGDSAYHGDRDD